MLPRLFIMMHVRSLFSVTVLAAVGLFGCSSPPAAELCPTGWQPDAYSQAGCRAGEEVASSTRSRLGTGILGFARAARRDCRGGDGCQPIERWLPSDLEIRVYERDPAYPRGVPMTSDEALVAPAAKVVLVTRTDAQGVYAIALPPGQYVVAAVDPTFKVPSDLTVDTTVTEGISVAPLVFGYVAD